MPVTWVQKKMKRQYNKDGLIKISPNMPLWARNTENKNMVSKIDKHMIKFMNTEVLSSLRMITRRTRKLAKMPRIQTIPIMIVDRGIEENRLPLPYELLTIDSKLSEVVLSFSSSAISRHKL